MLQLRLDLKIVLQLWRERTERKENSPAVTCRELLSQIAVRLREKVRDSAGFGKAEPAMLQNGDDAGPARLLL